MAKYKIDQFMCEYYTRVDNEYDGHKDAFKRMYETFFSLDLRSKMEQGELYICRSSTFCNPSGWECGIGLLVDLYRGINLFYTLEAEIDLNKYVELLTHDENFKKLVMAAIYIVRNIKSRN